MAPRAYWKGYLKLSLVSCPIALYPASSSSERVSFNRINKKTGHRLKQQNVDSVTGDPVEKDDIGRGYEFAKGQYIQVEDDELAKIQIESTHTIDIERFRAAPGGRRPLSRDALLSRPTDKVGQEAFAVIRDAIREKKMAALGRIVLTRREHVVMLEAFDKGLLATTLRYDYEVRDQKDYFEDIPEIKLPEEMKELGHAHHRYQGRPLRPEGVRGSLREGDRRASAQEAGRPRGRAHSRCRAESPRVINLMDALRASLKAKPRNRPRRPRPHAEPARRRRRGEECRRRSSARPSKATSPSRDGSAR